MTEPTFTVTGTVTCHFVDQDLMREFIERQTEYTEAIAAILEKNPDGPWTLEELEALTPSVNNSGA